MRDHLFANRRKLSRRACRHRGSRVQYLTELRVERLEDRRMLMGSQVLDPGLSPACPAPPDNIECNLAAYCAAIQSSAFFTKPEPSLLPSPGSQDPLLRSDQAGRPLVDVWTTGPTTPVVAQMGALGLGATVVSTSDRYHLVEAWLNAADLPVVATMTGVLSLSPVYRPIACAGSVQTQGDAVVHADNVRNLSYDGSPLLISVISDSAYGIAASQSTGDLPAVVDRYLEFPASDEGRAMLEIVHDVAPGASLSHCSGIVSESSFADGIGKLASTGASVICDDLCWPTEPFFQDGIVAQAVDDVADSYGVTYVSAAGNSSTHSYEHFFVDSTPSDAGSDYHDFGSGIGVDTRQRIAVPCGYYAELVLQWDDPFYTANGVTHDFDMGVTGFPLTRKW